MGGCPGTGEAAAIVAEEDRARGGGREEPVEDPAAPAPPFAEAPGQHGEAAGRLAHGDPGRQIDGFGKGTGRTQDQDLEPFPRHDLATRDEDERQGARPLGDERDGLAGRPDRPVTDPLAGTDPGEHARLGHLAEEQHPDRRPQPASGCARAEISRGVVEERHRPEVAMAMHMCIDKEYSVPTQRPRPRP
ncbi:MAG: hypothetical protein R3D28_11225 [Geminicoccaceae bacterium]